MTAWRGADRESLRRALLSPAALAPMIMSHPRAAAELVLAALLREPSEHDPFSLRPDFGISDRISRQAPLPENGPMIAFFTHASDVATPTLLEIVEHATAAWKQSEMATVDDESIGVAFEILLDGEWVTLAGDGNVMHWHRGDARVPCALASALMGLEQYLYRRLDHQLESETPLDELLATLMQSRSVAVFGVLVEVACYRPELLEGPLAPLATSAGLILADRLYKARDHAYLRMTMSESERRRLNMWHDMEHRSNPLDQAIMPRAVASGKLLDELAAGRSRWATEADDRWRFLIAQMDPHNYERVDLEAGGSGWIFRQPAELQQEIDDEQPELGVRRWWLTAPSEFARWIETQTAATDDEAQQLWDRVQQQFAETPLFEDGVLRRADVECGAAAVLLLCARTWVMQRPEVERFCRDALIQPFGEPPPTHAFDSPEDPVDTSWDGFAAVALPVLWELSPHDDDLRHCAAHLAVHRHFGTVRRLFAALQRHPRLQEDARRLETLSLHWARYLSWRYQRRFREQHQAYWPPDAPRADDLPDLEPQTEAICTAFVDGSLDPHAPTLQTFIEQTPEGMLPETGDRRHRLAHAIDVPYLAAARAHIFSLDDEPGPVERARRLDLASQFASLFAGTLVPDESGEVDGTPGEEEYRLFGRLGAMTARADIEKARAIWQPIMAVGTAAQTWLSPFISEMWMSALALDPPPEAFPSVIKEMLALADASENWTGWHTDELVLDLLCLSRYGYPRMEERHRQLLAAMQPEWAESVHQHIHSSYSARSIIPFLGRPVASDLVPMSLQWLAERERNSASADDEVDQAIAEILAELIGRDPQLVRRPDAATVLSALVGRQNAVALQISAALG